ncbi:MAG: YbaK/EbsC family protein [Planctomycetota bacterium]
MPPTAEEVHLRLVAALAKAGVTFRQLQHEAVFTSAQAATVRGTTLHSGAKALILNGDDRFVMVVLPADMALDSKAIRKHFAWSGLRFATEEEVLQLTGLRPGSIPPFGSLLGLSTLCDERLSENAEINFNAASHTDSIAMSYEAYFKYESPIGGQFAK